MKVVAFNGSPRVEGNTDKLLQESLKPAVRDNHDIKVFRLNLMKIRPCQNCGGCDETGVCVLRDDDMGEIYREVREADRIILASPIFFFALSAQIKAMIDRFQCIWCERYLLGRNIEAGKYGRKGLLLLVGGMKKEIGIQCGEATAKAFFRTISVPQHETLGFTGIDRKGAILEHPEALKNAFEAGERLIKIEEDLR
ncbi:MAG: flavodoxin family protein [Syntrophorhabdaceae bacterium]|nr:flavodoxin family protein [Syntrophorhabdaceae bacterium]